MRRCTTFAVILAGISEGICAPVNEVEGYNKGFVEPAQQKRNQ